MKRQKACRRGFTIIEMSVSILIILIIVLGVVGLLANSQSACNRMHRRVFGEVITDAEIARRVFDIAVRKSSIRKCLIGESGESAEVYYYANAGSTELDRYERFYFYGNNLMVQRGDLEPGTFDHATGDDPSVIQIARNVTSGLFVQSGVSLRMYLTLDNSEDTISVACSSTRHNE